MSPEVLGGFEHQILLAILRLKGAVYTVPIVLEIERRTGREVAPAAVYIALRRLENKRLLSSKMGSAAPGGGKPRRYFALTDQGLERLRESRRTLASLWDGVETLLDESP